MKIVEKPDIRVFASEAKTGEVLSFPDVLRGWGITLDQTQGKPPLEWMNDAFNRIDLNNLYLLQQGIPEWDKDIRYPVNSIIKHTGKIYLCSVENENNEPSASSDKWSLYIRSASEKEKGVAKIATQTEVNAGTNDTSFVTPKKLEAKISAIPNASLTEKGLSQLTSTLSDDETKAATPKMVSSVNLTAVNAQIRADAAFTKVKPITEGGTGATTAESARKNLGLGDASTRNVATSLDSNGNTLVPLNMLFGYEQKWVDVTKDRLIKTPYKNNTLQTIFISIDLDNSTEYFGILVDGVKVALNGHYGSYFPVPPGSIYEVEQGIIQYWAEFRKI